jgi:hypothetical protein
MVFELWTRGTRVTKGTRCMRVQSPCAQPVSDTAMTTITSPGGKGAVEKGGKEMGFL